VILIVLALPNGVRDLLKMILPASDPQSDADSSTVIARSVATKQSSSLPNASGLLRSARNDDAKEAGHG